MAGDLSLVGSFSLKNHGIFAELSHRHKKNHLSNLVLMSHFNDKIVCASHFVSLKGY